MPASATKYSRSGVGDRRFGELPEYFVKLGGIGSLRSGYDWHERSVKPSSAELAAALRPYFEWRIEKLGADRCMFESNFPVEKLSTAYVNLWNGAAILSRHHRLQRANVGRLSALLRELLLPGRRLLHRSWRNWGNGVD
jgi:hypothetical protein